MGSTIYDAILASYLSVTVGLPWRRRAILEEPYSFAALAPGDGLLSRLTGNPTLPSWLGEVVFSMVKRKIEERQIRQATALIGWRGGLCRGARRPGKLFEVGPRLRALRARCEGTRRAHRFRQSTGWYPGCAQWPGLGSRRPDMVVRFGRAVRS